MKRKGESMNSKSLISRIMGFFSKNKTPKDNNFDLWENETPQKINTKDEILKDIKEE